MTEPIDGPKEPRVSPIMSMYFQQLHALVMQINKLSHEYGDPHTVTITAHFKKYALSQDIRIFRPEDTDE